jgi:hypothetical protein
MLTPCTLHAGMYPSEWEFPASKQKVQRAQNAARRTNMSPPRVQAGKSQWQGSTGAAANLPLPLQNEQHQRQQKQTNVAARALTLGQAIRGGRDNKQTKVKDESRQLPCKGQGAAAVQMTRNKEEQPQATREAPQRPQRRKMPRASPAMQRNLPSRVQSLAVDDIDITQAEYKRQKYSAQLPRNGPAEQLRQLARGLRFLTGDPTIHPSKASDEVRAAISKFMGPDAPEILHSLQVSKCVAGRFGTSACLYSVAVLYVPDAPLLPRGSWHAGNVIFDFIALQNIEGEWHHCLGTLLDWMQAQEGRPIKTKASSLLVPDEAGMIELCVGDFHNIGRQCICIWAGPMTIAPRHCLPYCCDS